MSDDDVAELNARFGIQGVLSFKTVPGGLMVAEIANAHATATIALQGAHLMTWTPVGQRPVIWLSRAAKLVSGKSIRGGVPICWPWFGPHATDATFPGHGFARTVPWRIIEAGQRPNGDVVLGLTLEQDETTRKQWPYPSEVIMRYVVGAMLECELITRNTGSEDFMLGDALHTYFEVSDIRQARIDGLDDCLYVDKVDGGARKRQVGPVTISGEVDRIYLGSTADCLIEDPQWQRRIRVSKRGSASTVVWNPWSEKAAKMGDLGDQGYLNMVCVESANAADDVVKVRPGGEHALRVRYAVEAL